MPATDRSDSRPRLAADFFKAHGLGNDYLVFPAGDAWVARREAVARVCHRHRGVGSDGIIAYLGRGRPEPSGEGEDVDVVEPAATGGAGGDTDVHRLEGFNPDGSEFERSGNGLRVFAAYLAARGVVGEGEPFRVTLGGDVVEMEVLDRGPGGRLDVRVDMGRARTGLEAVRGIAEPLTDEGRVSHPGRGDLAVTFVSVGNPHGVYFTDRPGVEVLRDVGPFLSTHRAFPRGLNVQVARVVDPGRLHVLVWERGVGETSASGTSACAAAVAAVSTGRAEPGPIQVEMEGGTLGVTVSPELDVELRGPVGESFRGALTAGFCEGLGSPL